MSALKPHFAIMKAIAIQDWNTVKKWTHTHVQPKKDNYSSYEDSTAEMLSELNWPENIKLQKGISYYKSLRSGIKTQFEINRKIEENTCTWGDNLEACFLLSHKFITINQDKSTKRKIDAYFRKKEFEIKSGKF